MQSESRTSTRWDTTPRPLTAQGTSRASCRPGTLCGFAADPRQAALVSNSHRHQTTGRNSGGDTSHRIVLDEAGCMHSTYTRTWLTTWVDNGIRSQADPPLRRAGPVRRASQSSLKPRRTLLHCLVHSDLPNNCQPAASPSRHGAQVRPVVGRPARVKISSFRKQACSDYLLTADAWYYGPICVQPGPGIPSRAGPSRPETHFRKISVSETPHSCSCVGEVRERRIKQ